MVELGPLVSTAALGKLTNATTIARATAYTRDHRVEALTDHGDRVTATVRGTTPYRVTLSAPAGRLAWSCTCPVGHDGTFCKHVAAVAMTVSGEGAFGPGGVDPADDRRRKALRAQKKDDLVELLVDTAHHDDRLADRLDALAATAKGEPIDLKVWRSKLTSAFRTGGFVEYRRAPEWANRADAGLDSLQTLLDAGHADEVVVLAEKAHALNDKAVGRVDDSDGWITNLSLRIADLHLAACRAAQPDPKKLAKRLVKLDLDSELDTFRGAAHTYAGVLGEVGLAEYRRLLEPKWEAARGVERFGRFNVSEAWYGLLLGEGRIDEFVALYDADHPHASGQADIVRALDAAGRTADARAWAERSLDRYADAVTHQRRELESVAADLAARDGDAGRSLEIRWGAFADTPTVSTYRALLDSAGDDAGEWRSRAIDHLETQVRDAADPIHREHRASRLVEILTYEGELDRAWQVAQFSGAERRVMADLATARELEHPADAIPSYQLAVAEWISRKNRNGYKRAVRVMAKIADLYARADDPDGFTAYVAEVRAEHRQKSSLMALLDEQGW